MGRVLKLFMLFGIACWVFLVGLFVVLAPAFLALFAGVLLRVDGPTLQWMILAGLAFSAVVVALCAVLAATLKKTPAPRAGLDAAVSR